MDSAFDEDVNGAGDDDAATTSSTGGGVDGALI